MARLSQDPANLAPFIITPRAKTQARRVQSVATTGDRPSTNEREIGNETFTGTTFDTPEVTVNVEANLVNGKLLAAVANRDPGATFTNLSLEDLLGQSDVDLNMQQRNTARTAWVQSVFVKQAGIGSYRLAASTDASATETIELRATNKTAFEKYVQTDNLTSAGANQTAWTLTDTPVPLTRGAFAGNKALSVAIAEPNEPSRYLLEGVDYTIAGTTLTLAGAALIASITANTQMAVSYMVAAPPGDDDYQAKDTTSPAAIRGYYHVPVTLTANANNKVLTSVQSIEATLNFGIQREVGMGSQAIGFFRQTPAELTGSFTVFSEDFSMEKLMQAGNEADASGDYPIDGWRTDIDIKLEFKHPETGVVQRTDVLDGLTITGDVKDVRVGQAVGKQYNFTASAGFIWKVTKNV